MNKSVSVAFLVVGIIAIIYGVSSSDSIASGFSRIFTGSPTDKTIYLLLCGSAALIIGTVGFLRSPRSS